MDSGKVRKEGKRPGLDQNHFPGCVLEAFEYLDACCEKRLHILWDAKWLIEKVFAPFFIAMPDKAHQLAGSVESKRTGPTLKFESGLFRRAITFAVIAAVAACDQVFP